MSFCRECEKQSKLYVVMEDSVHCRHRVSQEAFCVKTLSFYTWVVKRISLGLVLNPHSTF